MQNNTTRQLTLEQKCALLSGGSTFQTRALPGCGIPAIWLSDGPHGVRKQAGPADHLGINPSEPATCFPTASAVASSWDPALGEEIGRALGQEAAAQDVAVVLGPGLNTKRSPLCGRNFEYFSEDPYLAGKMAAAYIRGIQENGIAACPKHFAANNQELRRMASDSIVDERTLRELYLTNFEIAVTEGKPRSIMTSYNMVNGTYANENLHLLQEILRDTWGFDGAVVTDWGGSNDHVLGVKNGSTLEMPAPGLDSARELCKAVRDGKISEVDINARLEELLTLIDQTTGALEKAPKTIDWDAHRALARKAAAESIVLLKNKGGLLPLDPAAKVAVIGDFAKTPRYQGAGSSLVNAPRVDSFLDVLEASGIQTVGYAQGFDRQGKPDGRLQAQAVELAAKADVVLLFLGLDEVKESEGLDRSDMKLAQNQIDLLLAVHRTNPRLAVILSCGSAVETGWQSHCEALLWAGLGGQAGAGAVLDALTGKVNPAGRLAETWPIHCEDNPSYKNFGTPGRNVEYREGLYVGYRYYQTAGVPVAYPFGYGLSYTTFAYRDLTATPTGVSVTVENTGDRAGDEVVQVYIAKPDAKIFRPAQELKGFARVHLEAGESRTVTIPLDDKAFRYWNDPANRWAVEGGDYEVRVGGSSADIRLTATVAVAPSGDADPYAGLALPHYQGGQVQDVPDEEFAALLGHAIPVAKVAIDRNMTLGEIGHARSPLGWLVHVIHKHLLDKSLASGTPDLNLLFNYNMPLRAIAKMTGGIVSMGMVDALVMELKGFWIIGIVRLLVEFVKNDRANKAMEKRLSEGGRKP
ncbi:glycoside hydrolase family 3 C-terminal domain-containing protein [Subdoligranulum variabile]|uniref:Glycosyl hydrolase family 3 N-terminal domain protein n=1 Tax=Subdoligranulum variabile DSM 15176 TaxID=411471 RepID=D1PS76_9FIRM|nr:glycoside hydrolase family 3 C-terminal domain-containing protein [Subdoligranulum variabile]EFB74453.1 glycosyl hydrolase family 3 N-terminal domain protein [Subdoligranulum variabile DSM 15176]UWP69495.1 glycoside hydrolase family 3 C-terminal domain-containing protein [Subdoligranulum variabile]